MRAETDPPLMGSLPIMTDRAFLISPTSNGRNFTFKINEMVRMSKTGC
jgi:hypothetical protein